MLSSLLMADQLIAFEWPSLFVAMNFHRTDKNLPMDFGRYPAQVDYLKDDSQRKVTMKAVQVGVTELAIVACLTKAAAGWSVLYSLPTEALRNSVVANRIDKPLKAVPLYQEMIKNAVGESDQVGLKHIGKGTIKFVGSNSSVAYLEFPADMIIIDEVDKSDQDNLQFAADRLDASTRKYDWRIGNPTYTKYGIHAAYLESDQKQWHIRCEGCGLEQPLDFFRNAVRSTGENEYKLIDGEWRKGCGRDIKIFCRECGQPIDRLAKGRWIPKHPGREISGYHFSQLFSPTVTVEKIYAQFVLGLSDPSAMQVFYNSKLGLPYNAVGSNLTPALLEAKCMDDYLMPSVAGDCTMGVDVGGKLHVRISDYPEGNLRRAVCIDAVHSWEELSMLIERYGVTHCVVDAKPELHKAREFQARHPEIVWLCDYATNEKIDFWDVNEDEKTIRVDRTACIDGMVSQKLTGKDRLPRDFRSLDEGEYVEQMQAPKRKLIIERNKEGRQKRPRYVWDEEGNPDHHFHADVYDYLALQIRQLVGDLAADAWWMK